MFIMRLVIKMVVRSNFENILLNVILNLEWFWEMSVIQIMLTEDLIVEFTLLDQ